MHIKLYILLYTSICLYRGPFHVLPSWWSLSWSSGYQPFLTQGPSFQKNTRSTILL